MSSNQEKRNSSLPVLTCEGCGVCCFHMGFPAFVMPRDPMTEAEIDADPELAKLSKDSRRRKELLSGHPGESWWHILPDQLKQPLIQHMEQYIQPEYDGTLESLDGPCIWLDKETRLCKHHQHRPNVCRDFETGCSDCHQWRKEYAAQIKQPDGSCGGPGSSSRPS